MNKSRLPSLLFFLAVLPMLAFGEDEPTFELELEIGSTWQNKNDVQIPNNLNGDRFDLTDISGQGPWPSVRFNGIWNINNRHGLRLVLAPLEIEESGRLNSSVRFDGATFQANTPLEATYRFNSWRLGYRYKYFDANNWKLWVGATAKLRDAEVTLRQGQTRATDDDIGFVPLLYLAGEYRFNDKWLLSFDFDGLAGGPGRAIDLSLKLGYELNDRWRITAGYRALEGGADTDDVYNFAWFNTALVSAQYRF